MQFRPQERVGRFEEGIRIIRHLWHDEHATHHGAYYDFEDVTIEPRPIQRPMPVWIANDPKMDDPELARRQCQRVAALADGWMTNGGPTPAVFAARWALLSRCLEETGRDPGTFPTSYHMMVNINSDASAAWNDGVDFLTKYYGKIPDDFLRVWLAAGPAEEVARRIQEYIDAGCRVPIIRFAAWDAPVQIRRFLDDVHPRLRVPS